MREFFIVLKEQFQYFPVMWRLSRYESKTRYQNNALGTLWLVINPVMQIATYWLVFGIAFKSRTDADGIPYLPWLVIGMGMWLFLNTAFNDTNTSIAGQVTQVMRMKFPVSILPMMKTLMNLTSFWVTGAIGVGMALYYGLPVTIYWLQILYYFFASLAFLYVFGIFNATMTVLLADYAQLVQTIMRFGMWISGAMWDIKTVLGTQFPRLTAILELNPFYYLVSGWRSAFFDKHWFWQQDLRALIFFWTTVLLVGIVGSHLHLKFRAHFADLV